MSNQTTGALRRPINNMHEERMKPTQFRKWLEKNYDRKQPREKFLADFNAFAQMVGVDEITWPTVNHWMYDRQPPTHVGPVTFDQALELIGERRVDPARATRVYMVALPVKATTEQAIERKAWLAGVTPEEWLRATLEAGLKKLTK